MPKYHFEIVDSFTLEDPVGVECSSDTQAQTVAEDMARQIAADLASDAARKVVVRDDDGGEVYATDISELSGRMTTTT